MQQWSRIFPGRLDQVAQARKFTGALLEDHPMVDEARAVVTELAANAVLHTESGGLRGRFMVRIWRFPDRVRVSVLDYGSALDEPVAHPMPEDPLQESGRGLALVAHYAKDWGVQPLTVGNCVWADLLHCPDS